MQRIFNIGIVILGVLCFVLWYLLIGATDPYSDILFYISYVLFAIALGAVLIYSIVNIVSSGEKIKRTAIGVGALAVVVVIGFVLAKPDNIDFESLRKAGINITDSTSKTVGAGLYMFYILSIVAVGAMVFGGIKKLIK